MDQPFYSPRVSVVMAVYNGERFLAEAVDSILNQTFRDFEFIIIDDGSTDSTPAMLAEYAARDPRIRILSQENRGLIASLNRGCREARGELIARMDADDISLPSRFEKQVAYLDAHPEVGVVSCWMGRIDEEGGDLGMGWEVPTRPGEIGWGLLFGSCVVHAAAMIRRGLMNEADGYRPEALHVEDYDLWLRLVRKMDIASLPEVLFLRRVWKESVCSREASFQEEQLKKLMGEAISGLLGQTVDAKSVDDLRQVFRRQRLHDLAAIRSAASLLKQMRSAYISSHRLSGLERRNIAIDLALKLATLSGFAFRCSCWQGMALALRAWAASPLRLPLRMVRSLIRRLVTAVRTSSFVS